MSQNTNEVNTQSKKEKDMRVRDNIGNMVEHSVDFVSEGFDLVSSAGSLVKRNGHRFSSFIKGKPNPNSPTSQAYNEIKTAGKKCAISWLNNLASKLDSK